MKIKFFEHLSFNDLLSIRSDLCNGVFTGNEVLDTYILTDRPESTMHTRINRCISFIDMIIVRMAISGKLVDGSDDPSEINFNRP